MTGFNSSIVRELQQRVNNERIVKLTPAIDFEHYDRYLFAAGFLQPKRISDQSADERQRSITLNFEEPLFNAEEALQQNPKARVVIIGSESAFLGSFDQMYAVAKSAITRYVELRPVSPSQFLGLISPPIIADSGMTMRRHDYPEVLQKRRHVFAKDVAEIAFRMLYEDKPGHNVVVRM